MRAVEWWRPPRMAPRPLERSRSIQREGLGQVRWDAMYTIYQVETMMHSVVKERLEHAELHRRYSSALRRSRARSTLRRAIQEGLRCGIEPHEVEREFTMTLQQIADR